MQMKYKTVIQLKIRELKTILEIIKINNLDIWKFRLTSMLVALASRLFSSNSLTPLHTLVTTCVLFRRLIVDAGNDTN